MADIFTFDDIEFRALPQELAKVQLIRSLIVLLGFYLILIPLSVLVNPWIWVGVAVISVVSLLRMLLIYPRVKAFRYAPQQNELLIKKGIFFKNVFAIPYGRIQYVEASQGPLMRYFNLSSIQIYTASSATEGTIRGLYDEEAAALRAFLSQRCEAEMVGL
ncbi:PH domain-containing protein [Gleimia sp. 6138-11-ORH1]|uniref:PH domain-containing protein n=1 Tax=Gleimia sp. 6138-11-ORH1 TaxID=2973937 RepID=UPI002167F740|nr:PH domain-containing protein [Gleimia sp. 6138-11-ORH1]MCS4484762.1 PH domain-containing protein [Gleimia sp. 6138-11-ORH1]